jgi:hypothetical protein
MVIGGFHMGNAPEQEITDTIERLIELGVKEIFPIHCTGDTFREYMEDHYPQYYGEGHVGLQLTININFVQRKILSLIYSIVIVAVVISLFITGLFLRKKFEGKRA